MKRVEEEMEAYEATYERYVKFAERIGSPVLPFEQWMKVSDRVPVQKDDSTMRGFEDSANITGRSGADIDTGVHWAHKIRRKVGG